MFTSDRLRGGVPDFVWGAKLQNHLHAKAVDCTFSPMNIRDFTPNPFAEEDTIDGLARGVWIPPGRDNQPIWPEGLDSPEHETLLRLRLRISEQQGVAFYEDWVSRYIEIQAPEVAAPIVNRRPYSLVGLEEAHVSARAARLQIFDAHYPRELTSILRRQAALGDAYSMAEMMALWESRGRQPTSFSVLRLHLACFWTSHYLWLMSDMNGSTFFRYAFRLEATTEGAYGRARRDIHLVPGPTQLVQSVTVRGEIIF